MKKINKIRNIAVALLLAFTATFATACSTDNASNGSDSSQVIAPVTVSIDDLQGSIIEIKSNEFLNINTGDIPTSSFSAAVSNPEIAVFEKGKVEGTATFNPGFSFKKPGTVQVTMKSDDPAFTDTVVFTIEVTD